MSEFSSKSDTKILAPFAGFGAATSCCLGTTSAVVAPVVTAVIFLGNKGRGTTKTETRNRVRAYFLGAFIHLLFMIAFFLTLRGYTAVHSFAYRWNVMNIT